MDAKKANVVRIDMEGNVEANPKPNKKVPKGKLIIDDSTLISVKSNVFGELIYINRRNGEKISWVKTGEIHELTMGDLRAMKASQIGFFANQWIIVLGDADGLGITGEDVYRALGISRYYENIVDPSELDEIKKWTPEEIKSKVSLMSFGARDNLTIALNEYIRSGRLDSLKSIRAFEEALGCELTQFE